MSDRRNWANAYARQANADFQTWSTLQLDSTVPECHKLLLLQMTCEKLTKAYLCSQGSDPRNLQSSHAYVAKNLPAIIRHEVLTCGGNPSRMTQAAKHLAQEIELLAPAVKRGGQRLDNCEYPWEDHAGTLHVPLDWSFTTSNLLTAPAGRTFLKLVHGAILRLL